jgi:hypothetical protein
MQDDPTRLVGLEGFEAAPPSAQSDNVYMSGAGVLRGRNGRF